MAGTGDRLLVHRDVLIDHAIATDLAGAVLAVEQTAALDRAKIRGIAVERFGVDRMVDQYVAVYEQAIAGACHT